jgi:5-oxoprolinase (ATP-hydrolysing)
LLGIPVVIAPADSSLLSARGLLEARRERFAERQLLAPLDEVACGLAELWRDLETEARRALAAEAAEIEFEPPRRILRVRLRGHEAALDLEDVEDGAGAERAFVQAYRGLFGDLPPDRLREVESARVVVAERIAAILPVAAEEVPAAARTTADYRVRVARGWISVPGFERGSVAVGAPSSGPALIVESYTSVWVPEGWSFEKHPSGAILLRSITQSAG